MANGLLKIVSIASVTFLLSSCAGVKVINPNEENKNAGTLMLDKNGKFVETYSCYIVASNGRRVSGLGKTKEEAREEALATCRSQTLVSFCLPKNLKCMKN